MPIPLLIKKPILAAFGKAVEINLALQGRHYQYIFLLAHMRSGSTLLSHILGGNPEFDGSGESHLTYRTAADLPKLAVAICQRERKLSPKAGAKYLVDQINYNEFLTDEVLASPLIPRFVFLIRPPGPSLESMMSRFKWPENIAYDYYRERLKMLIRYSQLVHERSILIEYDNLVDRSEETLAALTNFIGVREPFRPSFEATKATARSADPSDNMWSGKIIRTKSHRIDISKGLLDEATGAFWQCRDQILRAGVKPAKETAPATAARFVS